MAMRYMIAVVAKLLVLLALHFQPCRHRTVDGASVGEQHRLEINEPLTSTRLLRHNLDNSPQLWNCAPGGCKVGTILPLLVAVHELISYLLCRQIFTSKKDQQNAHAKIMLGISIGVTLSMMR